MRRGRKDGGKMGGKFLRMADVDYQEEESRGTWDVIGGR